MGMGMLFKMVPVTVFALCLSGAMAQAQSLSQPSDLPPASFKGQQFVDSRGCVYLRAGIGGRVNWVARISANRQPLCGYPPTLGAKRVAIAAAAAPVAAPTVKPAAQAAAVNRPAMSPTPSVRSTTRQQTGAGPFAAYSSKPGEPMMTTAGRYDRRAIAAPAIAAPGAAETAVATRTNGCPAQSPYGKRAQLSDGRASLICSSDPGFDVTAAVQRYESGLRGASQAVASQAVAPRNTSGSVLTADDNAKGYFAQDLVAQGSYGKVTGRSYSSIRDTDPARAATQTRRSARAEATVTTDYKRVVRYEYSNYDYRPLTETGHYNSKRGQGTNEGWAQQDMVWSRDVPSVLMPGAPALRDSSFVTSTSNTARQQPASRKTVASMRRGGVYIQVGTFGQPANASGVAARLSQAGLPVAATRTRRGLRVVMAGPFVSAVQARQALAHVRNAGFMDAFIR